jgi:hypothetical protein
MQILKTNKLFRQILPRFYYVDLFKEIILTSELHHLILISLSEYDEEKLWLGGGFVRNLIWDKIHGISSKTKDVDIFYFNRENISKEADFKIECFLNDRYPSTNWSVKNQARMHIYNEEKQYESLNEAIKKFPETASAVICRLNDKHQLEIIAPYGLRDLFKLTLRPTKHFQRSGTKMLKYYRRVKSKKWNTIWKGLKTQSIF